MKYCICILFSLLCVFGYSQNDTELKRRAKEFFTFNRYEDALKTLRNSRNLSRSDEEGRFLIALCLYHLNQLDEAAEILNNLVANEKTLYPECWFYLGKIFHARHQFAEAGRYYKAYLKNIAPNDPNRRMVVDIIRRCANGQQYQYKLSEAYVESLGSQVNTPYDEFAPVLSVTYSDRLYFSSARESSMGGKRNALGTPDERFGQYFSDMYFCENQKGVWTGVQPMPIQMNSPRHEVLLDFNKAGTALIYFKGLELYAGEMLVDTFRQSENRVLSSDPFISPIDTRTGDCAPFFYNDTLVLFASRRPGGYGGYDLYKISFKNNRWTTPQNLGPDINTAYDETSAFLARDGKTLYFSSNYAERSIGGLDVFRSVYIQEADIWTEPQNLGLPINSAGDDDHFRLARDGFTGFFDSSRKDGLGQRDLYIAYFNDYLNEMEAPATEYVYVKPKPITQPSVQPPKPEPVPPIVEEINNADNVLFFNSESDLNNAKNTRFLKEIADQLNADTNKKLAITSFALTSSNASTALSQAISRAERAAALLTRQGVSENAIFMRGAIAESAPSGQNASFGMVFKLNEPESLVDKGVSAEDFDAQLQQDLVYKVQIASSKVSNYNNALLLQYAHPMVEKTLDFEYYRYTVGAVDTFAEAEQLRRELVSKGITGAFIGAYVYGRRVDAKNAKPYVQAFPDLRNYVR